MNAAVLVARSGDDSAVIELLEMANSEEDEEVAITILFALSLFDPKKIVSRIDREIAMGRVTLADALERYASRYVKFIQGLPPLTGDASVRMPGSLDEFERLLVRHKQMIDRIH
jgi:hypothetical protein